MVEIKYNPAHRSNRGGERSLSKIKYLVIHYTSNDGDTDENNGKYFANNVVKSSAHYFVDDDSITQSVLDNQVAWAVGGNKYASCAQTGGGRLYGKCTNTNSLSIEICDDVKNGVVYPSAKTIENALELAEMLMAKYKIPKENVIRHFDVTGKLCPAYWCGTPEKDRKWITEFWDKLPYTPKSTTAPTTTTTKGGGTVEVTLPILEKGSKGGSVTALQQLLNANGFDCGKADGSFGAKTDAALRKYQKAAGLSVDGSCGKNTWTALLS